MPPLRGWGRGVMYELCVGHFDIHWSLLDAVAAFKYQCPTMFKLPD